MQVDDRVWNASSFLKHYFRTVEFHGTYDFHLSLQCREYDGIFLDYSRQQVQQETMKRLFKLAEVRFPLKINILDVLILCY